MEQKSTTNEANNTPTTNNDWFLSSFVRMVNDGNGMTIGISLVTHGFIVSGFLCGGKEYFKGVGEEISEVFNGSKEVAENYAAVGEKIYSKDDTYVDKPIDYIHLKDARFFSTAGEPIPKNRGVWWRGRLSEISGFSLGLLSHQK